MKKLVVGSFAFVLALMLTTSVYAATLDITAYEGDNGLVGRSTPVNKGDVLNIKQIWDIKNIIVFSDILPIFIYTQFAITFFQKN